MFVHFQCKKDGSDLTEIISGCSKKQFDELWDGTQKTCTTTLLNLQIEDDEADNEETVETVGSGMSGNHLFYTCDLGGQVV